MEKETIMEIEEKRTIIVYAENCLDCEISWINGDDELKCNRDDSLVMDKNEFDFTTDIHPNCPLRHTMYKYTTLK